jgi:hypothetical protein
VVCLPWALSALALSPVGPGVDDKAAFFSEQATREASNLMTQIRMDTRRDLRVETFPEVPAEVKSGVNLEDKSAANQMYEKWAKQQAAARKVNGVYVLLVKNPAHLHVVASNETLQKAFMPADRDGLVSLMLGKLREKKFDEALLEGTRFVKDRMTRQGAQRRVETRAATNPGSLAATKTDGFGWIGTLLIVVLVVMVISRLISGLFSAMTGGGPALGGASSGGGFFRSMLGGLFGAAAGMWLYDHFFGHSGGSSLWGSESGNDGSFSSDSRSQEYSESDYSGSGGDFGDSSSDYDSGGGDSGGGDFGD